MARQVIIENPIQNSPFEEPGGHFKFSDDGITNEITESRRVSAYFVPVPRPKKRGRKQTLEDREEVRAYVKNHNVGFAIPYVLAGEEKHYCPDFLVRLDDDHSEDDLLNLVIEVTGQKRKDKAAKVATGRDMWVPAINNHGGFGRWAFLEIRNPWNAQNEIRTALCGLATPEETRS